VRLEVPVQGARHRRFEAERGAVLGGEEEPGPHDGADEVAVPVELEERLLSAHCVQLRKPRLAGGGVVRRAEGLFGRAARGREGGGCAQESKRARL
jgi:hypothetical protein